MNIVNVYNVYMYMNNVSIYINIVMLNIYFA